MKKKIRSIFLSLVLVLTVMSVMVAVAYAGTSQEDWLTFTSSGTTKVSFKHWAEGMALQYSIDDGTNWIDAASDTTIELNDGDTVKFKGIAGDIFTFSNYLRFKMEGDGTIAASGSVMSLFGNETECTPYCCWKMFQLCDKLTEAPELPATKMAEACYGMMFQDCWKLKKTPELPATDLAKMCYMHMFSYCYELADVPDLPATVLQSDCYVRMFEGCSNIKIRHGYESLKNACRVEFRISTEDTEESASHSLNEMFKNTDCDFYGPWDNLDGTPEINRGYLVTHRLTHHKLVPAMSTSAGNIEYWSCDRCGLAFADKVTEFETAHEIEPEKTVIPQIDAESITLSQTAYDYDGQAKRPVVSVTDVQGRKLTAGADYTVTYANNINAGTGTVTIDFIGKYAGEAKKSFTINCAHSYGTAKYLWTDDLSECIAYRACLNGCGTVEKETATAVKDGNVMKATFENEAFDTKTMPIPGTEHQHTFASDWSNDCEYHWHVATCGCSDIVGGFGKHIYSSTVKYDNGVKIQTCEVCNYQKKTTMNVTVPTITVTVPKPSIKSLTKAKKAFTVKWTKKSVTGYQIMYATNSKFTKGKKTIKVSKSLTVSKKISKLKAKKKYYVKVRCYTKKYGKTYYSSWSKKKAVTTK